MYNEREYVRPYSKEVLVHLVSSYTDHNLDSILKPAKEIVLERQYQSQEGYATAPCPR